MTDAEPDNVVDIHQNVAKDLLDKMRALYALAKTSQILQNGSYRLSLVDDVHQAIAFIGVMHKSLLDEALTHPDSDKIPKLVEVKKIRDEEAAKAEGEKIHAAEETKEP